MKCWLCKTEERPLKCIYCEKCADWVKENETDFVELSNKNNTK